MMYFRPDPEVLLPGFLLATIYGSLVRTYITMGGNGSTVDHLKTGQVAALPILWCPVAEQQEILTVVDRESSRIQAAKLSAQSGCELLREYRSALITAAVTGQLDIRAHEKKMEALA